MGEPEPHDLLTVSVGAVNSLDSTSAQVTPLILAGITTGNTITGAIIDTAGASPP